MLSQGLSGGEAIRVRQVMIVAIPLHNGTYDLIEEKMVNIKARFRNNKNRKFY